MLYQKDDWNQWNQWGSQWNPNAIPPPSWEWNISNSTGPDVKPLAIPNVPNNNLIPPPAPTISTPYINQCAAPNIPAMPPSIPPSFTYNSMPISQTPFDNQVNFFSNKANI